MKFENTEVWGFDHALRGMRNPKNSWNKSDSGYLDTYVDGQQIKSQFYIGPNDMKLAQSLIRAGSEHRKFMRQIFVSVDITAPLYWWKEFDTYKVGTVANSTSTMHKLASTPITIDCFETDDYNNLNYADDTGNNYNVNSAAKSIVQFCESLRKEYLTHSKIANDDNVVEFKRKRHSIAAKRYWKELIRWLPESWLQTRTVTMSYENLLAMCSVGQRRYHKLNEWSGKDNADKPNFIAWARTLPYAEELIFIDEIRTQSEN